MKYFIYSILFWVGVLFFALIPSTTAADTPEIILSEVQVAGEKADDEFIELYNTSEADFSLSGFQLRRKTASGTESSIKVFEKNSVIPAKGYFLWANSKGIFASPFADTQTSSSALSDNNSIALYSSSKADAALLDSLSWGTGALFSPETPKFSNPGKNKSFTRDTATLVWTLGENPTPTNGQGKFFSESEETKEEKEEKKDEVSPPPPPPSGPVNIRFNEVLPNPSDKGEKSEFIELYNFGTEAVALEGYTIKDASKTGSYTFPTDTLLSPQDFLVITRDTFKFALNNSNEILLLINKEGVEINRAEYAKTKEDISLNFSEGKWRGSRFLTPGAMNILNNLPETKEEIPKKGYKNVAVTFSAEGKDTDGDALKYTWDFGDGHKSYKKETSHKYKEKGTYAVTLTTSDGNEDHTETFTVKIESFPEAKVKITSLVPNPSGKDSDNEWIMLENRGKKSLNLKGFSIRYWFQKTREPSYS